MKYGFLVILFCAVLMPSYTRFVRDGLNTVDVYLNGTPVGTLDDESLADGYLRTARREVNADSDELILTDTELTYKYREELRGFLSSERDVVNAMKEVLLKDSRETLTRAYMVKIGQYSFNLRSTDDVIVLLQAALDKYQSD